MEETRIKNPTTTYFLGVIGLLILIGIIIHMHSQINPIVANQLAHTDTPTVHILPTEALPPLTDYIQIIDGCRLRLDSTCINAYTEPDKDSPVTAQLRIGAILKVAELTSENGEVWYKTEFDEWLRYPNRTPQHWYIHSKHVRFFKDEGVTELSRLDLRDESNKRIVVDRSDQTLYAFEDDELLFEEKISSGLHTTPTPRGTFTIYKKTPTRYMQGPIPEISTKYYDLPGVPWNLYFTPQGGVIHGAYWHEQFGQEWSNGCINLPTEKAEELYKWADIGTSVKVQD